MRHILLYTLLILGLQLIQCCSPDDYTYYNNENVDISTIDSVVLKPNQKTLIADGYARLDLRPVIFNKQGYRIPDSRVKEEWLEYTTSEGVALTRHFSTSDPSLVGKTITTQVKIKGTNVESQSFSFLVVAPLDPKYTTEITIPVIFHVIQTTEDIESYGGNYSREKIELQLEKFNNLFSGISSVNPVGVNTHIHFQMAQYDQYGQKMLTPGINRLTVPELNADIIANGFADFLVAQHLVWPTEKYMNIWLISDRKGLVSGFAKEVSDTCFPHYLYPGTPESGRLEGIEWTEFSGNPDFLPKESGVIYKLQELDAIVRKFSDNSGNFSANNELAYYVGRYFGLLPTCTFDKRETGTDYCDDTMDYWGRDIDNFNNTWYKTIDECYLRSENIMDDPTGLHVSVSKNQCERIRWVLEHCPERAAWKNDFAFTGIEK